MRLVVTLLTALACLLTVDALTSEYYDTFEALLPHRLQNTLHRAAIPNDISIDSQDGPYLYAGEFETVEELSDALFDDLDELYRFNASAPHEYYKQEEYDEAMEMPLYKLSEQLVSELWIKLFHLHQKYIGIFKILEKLGEKDYTALSDHIKKKHTIAYYGEGEEFDIEAMSEVDQESTIEIILTKALQVAGFDNEIQKGDEPSNNGVHSFNEIPFLEDNIKDYTTLHSEFFELVMEDSPQETSSLLSQGIKALIKIPLLIIKLVLVVIWNLIEVKKLVELAEAKVILSIFRLLKKICKTIRFLKQQIIFEIRVIIYTIKTKKPFYEALGVIFLIIKKLKQLSWILKDLLYRSRWKIYFVLKKLKKKSLAPVLYLKLFVYDKLGIPSKEEALYPPWVEKKEEYMDGDYFKTFSRYKWWGPATRDVSMDAIKGYVKDIGVDEYGPADILNYKDDILLDDEDDYDKSNKNVLFDMTEQYGFDYVRLNLKEIRKPFDSENENKSTRALYDGYPNFKYGRR